jgi:nitrite reductase/ring-hydroxylating ferredoxin subunit
MKIQAGEAQAMRPGEMRVFDLAGTPVNVSRVGDAFYAFEDRCTHMGCSLARGDLEGAIVTCACHGSQFDVTSGAVVRGPAQRPVRAIPLTVEDGAAIADPGVPR